jgi:phosphoglycolate phosphatase
MHLLVDLDGTLVDSAPGIARCLNHALGEVGCAPAADVRLRAMIGRPLFAIFGELLACDEPDVVERAVAAYRASFDRIALAHSRLFPGIGEALDAFRRAGHTMRVVTVKPVVPAARVLRHHRIDVLFDAVHGAPPEERAVRKADLVGSAVRHAGCRSSDAVMIGDRSEDIAGAKAHDVSAVGVSWGYGAPNELVEAGADYVAETADALVAWVQERGARHAGRAVAARAPDA